MSTIEESQFISQFLAVFSGTSTKYPKDFIPPGLAPNVTSKRVTFERPAKSAKQPAATGTIEVTIKSLKSGQYTVNVSAAGTVLNLKEALAKEAGIDVQSQRLVLKGKALVDSKSLADYGIAAGSIVHLFSKAGGATSSTSAEAAPPAATTSASAPVSESASTTATVAAATAAAARKVTSYRGLSEAGTETARSSEFWYGLHSYLSQQFANNREDADTMLKGFLGQYRDLIGNAATKAIETELKSRQ
ncbi:Large proline-rich protein bag6 [Actinomortierella ambigua]|nr:Large proline-rich protein bag6 [Actinomortierella ambigua]